MATKRFKVTVLFMIMNFQFAGHIMSEMLLQSNGTMTLQPNVLGHIEDILWRWNNNKVVEFDQKSVQDYGQFKGRTILNVTTGALTLTRISESDSGEYVGELQIGGELVYHTERVKVLDAVGKASVSCSVSGTSVTLRCWEDSRPATQSRWEGPGIESQMGFELQLDAAPGSDSVYTCVLSNSVSQSSAAFPLQSCYPLQESFPVIPVVIPLLIIIILIIAGLLYYMKCYKKETRQKERHLEAGVNVKQSLLPSTKDCITTSESGNEGGDSAFGRVTAEEGFSPELPSCSAVPLHRYTSSPSAPPKTGSAENFAHRPPPAPPKTGSEEDSAHSSPAAQRNTGSEEDSTPSSPAAQHKTGSEEDSTHSSAAAQHKTGSEEDSTPSSAATQHKTGSEEDSTPSSAAALHKTGSEEDSTPSSAATQHKTGSEEDSTPSSAATQHKTGSEEDSTPSSAAAQHKTGSEEDSTPSSAATQHKTGSEEDSTPSSAAAQHKTGSEEDSTPSSAAAQHKTGSEENSTPSSAATQHKTGSEEDSTHSSAAAQHKTGSEEDSTPSSAAAQHKTGSEEDSTPSSPAAQHKTGSESPADDPAQDSRSPEQQTEETKSAPNNCSPEEGKAEGLVGPGLTQSDAKQPVTSDQENDTHCDSDGEKFYPAVEEQN